MRFLFGLGINRCNINSLNRLERFSIGEWIRVISAAALPTHVFFTKLNLVACATSSWLTFINRISNGSGSSCAIVGFPPFFILLLLPYFFCLPASTALEINYLEIVVLYFNEKCDMFIFIGNLCTFTLLTGIIIYNFRLSGKWIPLICVFLNCCENIASFIYTQNLNRKQIYFLSTCHSILLYFIFFFN